MEILFIDESGDCGLSDGSTSFFVLAGISIKSSYWKKYFWKVLDFRKHISQKYGLILGELKGSELFTHRGTFFNTSLIPKDIEIVYESAIDLILDPFVEILISVKSKKEFLEKQKDKTTSKNMIKTFNDQIWRELLLKFDHFLCENSTRTKSVQNGIIYFDYNPGQEKYVRKIIREFSRKYDQELDFAEAGIIEDVVFRDSKTSYFIQLADILAFSANRIISGKGKHDVIEIREEIKLQLMEKAKKWAPK